jgi:hypothetical protein
MSAERTSPSSDLWRRAPSWARCVVQGPGGATQVGEYVRPAIGNPVPMMDTQISPPQRRHGFNVMRRS